MSIVRSVVAPSAVEQLVRDRYAIDVTACTLHSVTIHDHYLVEAAAQRFMFRVYNAEHSASGDHPDGVFELELLDYLASTGQPVAGPRAMSDGSRAGRIDAAEGSRRYALFEYATGGVIYPPSVEHARILGATIAGMHAAMNGFSGRQTAPDLEPGRMLDAAVQTLRRAAGSRLDDMAFLDALASDLAREFNTFVSAQSRSADAHGIIAQHFTGTNNHWADERTPIFFSFSAVGRGWRAYDVACFLWQTLVYGLPTETWSSYLEGYESVRPLSEAERSVLPALAKLKMLHTMGFHTSLTKWMGNAFQDGAYWERHFGPLRRWHETVAAP
jgi:Ser/Thr protein kinase RdoA (MazF antagonist)